MLEYLICRVDDDWFDLDRSQFPEAFRPTTMASAPVAGWGDHRIKVSGIEIAFSYEMPGIQVSFEGTIEQTIADEIVDEIAANISRVTRQPSRVVCLGDPAT